MSRLIESIRLLNGTFHNVPFHQQRMCRSLQQVYQHQEPLDLESLLAQSEYPAQGLYKCRLLYDHLSRQLEFVPYTARLVDSLKLIEDNKVTYRHKFEDRQALDTLYARRGQCQDILIVKNGFVTDTYYANIAFLQADHWYTPSTTLLPGTMRQALLDAGTLQTRDIKPADIANYQSFKMINAMLAFDAPAIDVANIYP